jgi:hypothetical protein
MNRISGRLVATMATVTMGALSPLGVGAVSATGGSAGAGASTPGHLTLQDATANLSTTLASGAPDSFAGLWVTGDGLVHVGMTAVDASAARILHSFRYPAALRITTGEKFTHALLQNVLSRISGDRREQERSGVQVSVVYIDQEADVVAVGVGSDMPQARRYLADHYPGAMVRLEQRGALHEADCLSRSVCTGTLQGGIEIDSTTASCSSGVVAGALTNTKVLITAGHCFPGGTLVSQGSTTPIGNVQVREYSGQLDGEVISINTVVWQPSSCEYTSGPCANRADRGINVSVGDPDCKAGITTGYMCGSITATGATINVSNGPQLTNQNIANLCSLPGDSGGPNLNLGFGAIEGVTSTSNFTVVNGKAVCNSQPITTFTPILNFFASSGNYLPYNP